MVLNSLCDLLAKRIYTCFFFVCVFLLLVRSTLLKHTNFVFSLKNLSSCSSFEARLFFSIACLSRWTFVVIFFCLVFFRCLFIASKCCDFFVEKKKRLVLTLTHACACLGGWSGAIEAGWRDSNGIPTVRRTPDGVRDSCINGIFDDALSLDSISSRSIWKRKQQRKLKHIDNDDEIAKFNEYKRKMDSEIIEEFVRHVDVTTWRPWPGFGHASYRKFRWMCTQRNRRNIWLCVIDECHARYLCIAVCIAVALV